MVAYEMLVHNWSDRLERPVVHDVLVGRLLVYMMCACTCGYGPPIRMRFVGGDHGQTTL